MSMWMLCVEGGSCVQINAFVSFSNACIKSHLLGWKNSMYIVLRWGLCLVLPCFLKTSPSVSSPGFVDGGARRVDEAGRRLIPFLDELLAAVKTMVWQQPPVSH